MSSLPCFLGVGVLTGLGLLRTLSPLLPHIRGFSSSYPSPLIPMSQFPAPVYAPPESHIPPQLYPVPVCTECRSPPLALSPPSLLFQSISKCLQSTGSLSEASRPAAFSLTWVLIGDADYQGPIPDRLTQEPNSGLGVVSNVCFNKFPGDSDTASV